MVSESVAACDEPQGCGTLCPADGDIGQRRTCTADHSSQAVKERSLKQFLPGIIVEAGFFPKIKT